MRGGARLAGLALTLVLSQAGLAGTGEAASSPVTVIAHRGASGYLPEHTLEAYAYAYAAGADFIEPDLVLTRDGVLVARHEPVLDATTDVSARFPDRRADDGHFYTADLTWAELRSLRTVETRPRRYPADLPGFDVPRLEDIVALVDGLNRATGCNVGLYPELKWTAWHRARGLDPVAALRASLAARPFDGPLRIQSFEAPPLRELAQAPIPGATLVQLVEDATLLTDAALADVATYAQGLGPWLDQLAEAHAAGDDVVARAHAAGLAVDAWTVRADQLGAFPDLESLLAFAVDELAVDGLFTDHPDLVRDRLEPHHRRPPCVLPRSPQP
ncbi:MAG TPA: glycerophosphodiester phosphodiesterase family protein [Pseudomonadales bacterium]|nr:glycerophosphodiester phosphodiesterase family protein [Pseudomonadales bacterium]